MTVLRRRLALIIATTVLLHGCQQPLRSAESDEWFRLVTELQSKQDRLSKAHRQFVSEMANLMTAGDDAMPTKTQQKWLLTIKRRLEEGKR